MTKNNTVDTAQKGQTTIDKTPTGKVKTLKNAEERRKAREEQFRNFRINALKRRCKRYGFDEKKTEEYIEKLKKQMDAPNQYTIIVCLRRDGMKTMEQAILNAKLSWTHRSPIGEKKESDGYFAFVGDQKLVDKILEIAPPYAKIHRYAKKMEPVLSQMKEKKSDYVAKNTDKSTTAKSRRLQKKADKLRKKQLDGMAANDQKLHAELQKEKRMANRRKVAKKIKMLHKRFQKAALKANKKKPSTVVQLNAKKSSTGSEKASTETLTPRRRMNKAA